MKKTFLLLGLLASVALADSGNGAVFDSAVVYRNLGELYYNGEETKQDYSKAAQLWQKACDLGDARSCNGLGLLYHNGQGVRQDYYKAAQLYQKACEGGSKYSCKFYKEILAKISSQESLDY